MPKLSQQADKIAGPANRNGGGAHGVFQNEIPADDPGEDLTDRGISIYIGASGCRYHRRQFGIAQTDEGAGNAGENKGQGDRGAGVAGGGFAGEDEDTGSDNAADAQPDKRERAECLGQAFAVVIRVAAMASRDLRAVY